MYVVDSGMKFEMLSRNTLQFKKCNTIVYITKVALKYVKESSSHRVASGTLGAPNINGVSPPGMA